MYSIALPNQLMRDFSGVDSISSEPQLSPGTRYYICRLMRQSLSSESAERLKFITQLTEDGCSSLNEHILTLYPDIAELTAVILKLGSLVYFHQSLKAQASIHQKHTEQLNWLKQEIFYLLGCPETVDG